MKKNVLTILSVVLCCGVLKADPPTPDPADSRVETQLRVDIDKETKIINFLNSNNDPDILTHTYVLENADPYEIRPYVRNAVAGERISDSDVKVEALKFTDGTGILIVSAEDYRFAPQPDGGMSIDEIVEALDLPEITSSTGQPKLLYFPKYRNADDIVSRMQDVGLNVRNDIRELDRGADNTAVDQGLNAVLFYPASYNVKNVREMLTVYDKPIPEVKVKYAIYEITSENDGKLGFDYQAWKNGPGSDIFSAAHRFSNGWDFADGVPSVPYIDNSHTKFIKFSPRWNTRFIDFLVARGKAAVITSGEMNIQNVQEGRIQALTRVPNVEAGTDIADLLLNDYVQYINTAVDPAAGAGGGFWVDNDNDDNADGDLLLNPVDMHGNPITVNAAADTLVNLTISRSGDGTRNYFVMELDPSAGVQFVARGRGRLGTRVRCLGDFSNIPAGDWQTDRRYTVSRDAERTTATPAAIRTQGETYGFTLRLIPSVTKQSTTLDLNMTNTSLIGFQNNGTIRTERSEVNTKLMVSNNGTRFVVGGIDKKSVVSSVSKLPYLGSIPVLGSLFSSESEVTKKARVVAVLDCVPVLPASRQIANTGKGAEIEKAEKALRNSDKPENFGFEQFLVDPGKQKLDILP